MFQSLVFALVLPRLGYGNSMLVDLPKHLVRRLQSVQNAAAWLICRLRRFDHVTDALVGLRWSAGTRAFLVASLESSASRHYFGTVAVDLPPMTIGWNLEVGQINKEYTMPVIIQIWKKLLISY